MGTSFAQIVDVDFLDAHGLGLGACRFYFFTLTQVSGKGDHFTVVGFLQPLEDDRGIQTAGIGQDDFFDFCHFVLP